MRSTLRLLATASLACTCLFARAADAPARAATKAAPVTVAMDTTQGRIVLQLDPARAPLTVENFLGYVKSGFYEGLVFHRVIPGFMAQGGGYDAKLNHREGRSPVRNEADNGLHNLRGSIAMARTSFPHSATSEFFINLVDNTKLDFPSFDGWGYTVFGTVTEGMDVVGRIAAIPTASGGPFDTDVPLEAVVIKKVSIVEAQKTQP